MNIFLAFLQSEHKYPIPAYDFWERYIKNGIIESGHVWTECREADWARGLIHQSPEEIAKWKQVTWSKTVDWLRKHPVDLFLSYLYPEQIDPSALMEIQKIGIPCVNFFCDHMRMYKKIPEEFRVFDLNWVPEQQAIRLYKSAGYPYINLPMPMWVEPKLRFVQESENQQVTFIGSMDIQRLLLFNQVVDWEPDLPLSIYGNGWKEETSPLNDFQEKDDYTFGKKVKFNLDIIIDQGFPAFLRKIKQLKLQVVPSAKLRTKIHFAPEYNQYNKLIAQSMITLGVNRYPSYRFPLHLPDSFSRLRDIEAPMLGACYLTEYADGLELLYDTENEIAVYKNAEELVYKIKELHADPVLRKKLRTNGQKRALEEHSIPQSLEKIRCLLRL